MADDATLAAQVSAVDESATQHKRDQRRGARLGACEELTPGPGPARPHGARDSGRPGSGHSTRGLLADAETWRGLTVCSERPRGGYDRVAFDTGYRMLEDDIIAALPSTMKASGQVYAPYSCIAFEIRPGSLPCSRGGGAHLNCVA